LPPDGDFKQHRRRTRHTRSAESRRHSKQHSDVIERVGQEARSRALRRGHRDAVDEGAQAQRIFVPPDSCLQARDPKCIEVKAEAGNTKGGRYHCTIDLLFDWFILVCFANKHQNYQLSYS